MGGKTTLIPTLLLAAITCCTGLEFGAWPGDNDVMYVCAGGSVTLSWQYQHQENEKLVDMRWEFGSAFSTDIIASLTRGQFLPNRQYAHRLRHVPNAGLVLSDVTVEDTGNYSVVVNGYDSDKIFFSRRRTVYVQVAHDVMIQGDSLQVRQDPVALWNPERAEWALRLLCGTFTFKGQPPVAVIWTMCVQTPTGEETSSTSYESGIFSLMLPTPVTGGNYSCHIPNHLFPDVCAKRGRQQDDQETLLKAEVFVDEVKGRMTVMEAEHKNMKEKHQRLIEANAWFSQQLQSVEDSHGEMMANLSTQLRQDLQQGLTPLKQALVSGKKSAVAFFARLNVSIKLYSSKDLRLTGVMTNVGDGYNGTTGVFTAPLSGVYYLSGVAAAVSNDNRAYLRLMVEGKEVAFSHAFQESDHWQTGSCNAVMRMEKGHKAWLRSYGQGYFYGYLRTTFSGFLIVTDP